MLIIHLYLSLYLAMFIHEASHYLTAVALKIRVSKFHVGVFNFAVFTTCRTLFMFGWLPISAGIYVAEPAFIDESAPTAKEVTKGVLVALAGSLANLFLGWIILTSAGGLSFREVLIAGYDYVSMLVNLVMYIGHITDTLPKSVLLLDLVFTGSFFVKCGVINILVGVVSIFPVFTKSSHSDSVKAAGLILHYLIKRKK